jgi:hypothetical protein
VVGFALNDKLLIFIRRMMMKKLALVLLVIVLSNSAWASLTDGLVLHCEFEGNTQDSSSNNFDGTIRSGVSYTAGVDGGANGAAYFADSAAGIEFGNQSQINNLGNLFSIAFWTKIEAGNGGLVFDHDVVMTYDNDWWGGVSPDPWISMGNLSYTNFNSNTSVDDGTWRHVVFTRDQVAGTARIYIDGDLDATRTGQYNQMLASTTFNLGAADMSTGTNWSSGFVGSLDDFRLYNRVLSEDEIVELATTSSNETVTIEIISGTDGNGNPGDYYDQDLLTTFISASQPTETHAIVSSGKATIYPSDLVPDYIGSPLSVGISTTSASDLWGDFFQRFTLPEDFTGAKLDIVFTSDDVVKVYLNDNYLGLFSDMIAHTLLVTDQQLFVEGENTLEFKVRNSPWGSHPWIEYGTGKGSVRDGMIVEFEGQVTYDAELIQPDIEVVVDIKPGSCVNPLNIKSNGVLPVAILGTQDFDVLDIDALTIQLVGVDAVRSSYEDVGTPADGEDCATDLPDGILDLVLKFDTQAIVEAIGEVTDGEEVILELIGLSNDDTPIVGQDYITIRAKGKGL